MVRMGMRAALVAALLSVAFAAPAAAGHLPYDSGWYGLACTTSGGTYGYGSVKARGWIQEYGVSGTNYFVIKAKWQQMDTSGGPWFLAWSDGTAQKAKVSASFPNDATDYIFDRLFKFGFHNASDYTDYWNRIRFTVEAWDQRPGADQLLYRRSFNTDSC